MSGACFLSEHFDTSGMSGRYGQVGREHDPLYLQFKPLPPKYALPPNMLG